MLALLGGCLCHCLARSSGLSSRTCSSHDPAFWQPLDLTGTEADEEDHKSPLAGLVQEYYGPRSMLSEVTENIASVSSFSAPSGISSGAASATAFAGTSGSASGAVSAVISSSSK